MQGRIAFFDSGVGGLTLLRECARRMPGENFVYFGDNENAPYGNRSEAEICRLAAGADDARVRRSRTEHLADEVFQYYEDYLDLIDSDTSSCASIGSCVYNIKGFYISNRGNVSQEMTISDLKVRLMECSGSFGSGNWNTPLAG